MRFLFEPGYSLSVVLESNVVVLWTWRCYVGDSEGRGWCRPFALGRPGYPIVPVQSLLLESVAYAFGWFVTGRVGSRLEPVEYLRVFTD